MHSKFLWCLRGGLMLWILAAGTAEAGPVLVLVGDPVNRMYLVGWQNYDAKSLAVQLLDDGGTLTGDSLPIGDTGVVADYPRIAANSTDGGCLVTWLDRSWDPPEHHEVRAQIVGVAYDYPGDLNDDGDVDLDDFALFAGCMGGPGVTTPPPGCDPAIFDLADLDADNDVDLAGFAESQRIFGG